MASTTEAHSHDHGASGHGHDHGHGGHGHEHHHVNYFKVYWILVALLAVSIAGPEIGIKWVTLVTAFGIAIIKAYLVAANFMHLKFEKKYIAYLLLTAIAFMGIFYAGVSPDVMKHQGRGWVNVAAKQETERALKAQAEGKHDSHNAQEHGGH